jgi:basic membrane protein A
VRRFLFVCCFFIFLCSLALAQPFVVGIHYDRGDWSTPGFNQDVWDGVSAATRDLSENNIEVLLSQNRLGADGQLQSMPTDLDLIIAAGATQLAFAQAASKALPETHILLIDAVIDEAPNVNSIVFREYEVSYLLGYLAGTLTQTGILGFIGETQDSITLANLSTYTQGVNAACSECTVLSDYTQEPNRPEVAYSLAAGQQTKGVDIFFSPARGSSAGVVNYVNTIMCSMPNQKRASPITNQLSTIATSLSYTVSCQNAIPLFFIGDNNSQPVVGDSDNDPKTLNHGLSAIRKRADRLAYQALNDSIIGRLTFGTRVVGLSDGAIEYALNPYNQSLIPEELVTKLEEIKTQIISGEIILNLPITQ